MGVEQQLFLGVTRGTCSDVAGRVGKGADMKKIDFLKEKFKNFLKFQ